MSSFQITGAKIYFELWGFPITETMVNMWAVMALVLVACLILTHGLKTRNITRRQVVAEFLVHTAHSFTVGNMGSKHKGMAPFIGAVFLLSILCSLSGLLGVYPATADLSTLLGWSLLVFFMITFTKLRTRGPVGYLKSFTEPVAVITPINIISEISLPVSMAFRHFGNVASGMVIMALLHAALAALSGAILGWIPIDIIARFPLFEIGLPAVLSLYFDVFSGVLQAYIFCMLTTLYISSAAEPG